MNSFSLGRKDARRAVCAAVSLLVLSGCAEESVRVKQSQELFSAAGSNEQSLRGQKELLQTQLETVILENARLKAKIDAVEGEKEEFRERESLRARDSEESLKGCKGRLDDCSDRIQGLKSGEERLSNDMESLKKKLKAASDTELNRAERLNQLSESLRDRFPRYVREETVLSDVVNGRLVISISERLLFSPKGRSFTRPGRKTLEEIRDVLGGHPWEDVRTVGVPAERFGRRPALSGSAGEDPMFRKAAQVARVLAAGSRFKSAGFSTAVRITDADPKLGKGDRIIIVLDPRLTERIQETERKKGAEGPP